MSQLTQQEKENILKNYIPQYIPCPPASHPNTCIKLPIAFISSGEIIDALHYIPASSIKDKIFYYIDFHSHEDKKGPAEAYSMFDTYTIYDCNEIIKKDTWTQLMPVGNSSSRI